MMVSAIRKFLAVCFVTGLLSVPATAADVVLQWASTNANVTTRSGLLVATGNTRDAARFELVRLEGRRIALRAKDGTYVRAGIGPQTLLGTGSPHIRGWETFDMIAQGNSVWLRSEQNGKFVTVDRSGQLTASADLRGAHAEFRLITVPDRPRPPGPGVPNVSWQGQWHQIWIAGADGRGVPAPLGSRPSFGIGPNMGVTFTAGCNILTTRMDVRGRSLTFAPVVSTRRSCNNTQQVYEGLVASALRAARSWDFREGQIAFLDASGRRVLQIGR